MSKRNAPKGVNTPHWRDRIGYELDTRPSRQVVTRSPKWSVGYFDSQKMGAKLAHESSLELDKLRLLESTNAVALFSVQPKPVRFSFLGKMRRYTPDGVVYYRDGTVEIYEVKYLSDYLQPLTKAFYDQAKIAVNEFGMEFKVYTEVEIRQPIHLANANELLWYNTHEPSQELRFRILEAIEVGGVSTLGELEQALGMTSREQCGQLYGAALRNCFTFTDLATVRLSSDSRISGPTLA